MNFEKTNVKPIDFGTHPTDLQQRTFFSLFFISKLEIFLQKPNYANVPFSLAPLTEIPLSLDHSDLSLIFFCIWKWESKTFIIQCSEGKIRRKGFSNVRTH